MKDARIVWPNGAKCAVLLTIHVDGESLYNRDPAHPSPRRVSYGRYGPTRAVNRLLDLAERKGIPCSYFVPGQIAERYPDLVRRIDAHGHEIGFHGFDHEEHMYTDRSTQEWIDVIHRAQDTFEKIIGKRPWATWPRPAISRWTRPRSGTSNWGFAIPAPCGGMTAPTGRASRGRSRISSRSRPDGSWDDYPAFVYSFAPPQPKGQDRISSYRGVLSNWRHEFEGYYSEGCCMTFMLHPQIIGIPGRIQMLEELLDEMLSKGDVWFATGAEIADWWRSRY